MRSLRVSVTVCAVIATVVAGVALRDNVYWLQVLTLVFALGTVAQSWNLLAGYAGQWSLAQTAFFGIGAYAAGVALIHWDVPLLLAVPIGTGFTAVVALVVGVVTLRLRGHYFALVTFMLTAALFGLVQKFSSVTGGNYGLNVPLGEGTDIMQLQFQSSLAYYFVAAGAAALATLIVYWVARSRLGLLLRAIGDDEDAAAAVGARTLRLKVTAMMISAFMAALGGIVYLAAFKLMDVDTAFGVAGGLDPVVAGVLGGRGTVAGGLIGELILQPVIAEVNSSFGSTTFGAAQLVYGAILMLTILCLPNGVAGLARSARRAYVARRNGGSVRSDAAVEQTPPSASKLNA